MQRACHLPPALLVSSDCSFRRLAFHHRVQLVPFYFHGSVDFGKLVFHSAGASSRSVLNTALLTFFFQNLKPKVIQLAHGSPPTTFVVLVPISDMGSIYSVEFSDTGATVISTAVLPFIDDWTHITQLEGAGNTFYLASVHSVIAISYGSAAASA